MKRGFADLHIAGLAIAAMTACALPARAETDHALLAIPGENLLFLARYIAADLHLWEKNGLDLKIQNITGIGAMNAVIAGSAEFSMSSGPSITRAAAHGQKLVALATAINQSGQDVVLRKDVAESAHFDPAAPLALRAKVLKGRTMAVGGVGAIPDVVMKVVAREAGIAPNDIVATPMQPPEMMAAFSRGAIDGFTAGPPYIQQAVQTGTGVIISDAAKGEPQQFSPQSASLLLTRAGYCAEHHSVCTKMVAGVVAAIHVIHEQPKEALAVMKAHFGTYDEKVLEAAYAMVRAMSPERPFTTEKELENGDAMNAAAGFIKPEEKLARYDDLIDNQFVK